jgi:segregation and condensation protein A
LKPKLELVASNSPAPLAAPEGVPQQVEMPFAVVNGEPVTELPKDLYIPPQALEVFLEAFEGPLDLLLYLIRRQNLDILDIPLAEITRQYMQYIEVMQELQLELAGEYMVMAATLAEIKSRMLLPRPKVDSGGNEEDPRAELVRRLQEYERFKRAAEDIDQLPRLERDTWVASAELKDRKVVRMLPQVTLQEMLIAFKEVVIRAELFSHHHVARERLSVRERMSHILTALEKASFVEFVHMFRPEEGRMGVTVTFIAILELMREGLVEIVQAEPFAPIHLRASAEKRNLRLVANNETVEQVAQAAQLGETVLEEVEAGRLEAEAEATRLDAGFVDDDEDVDAEEEVEDFGLDRIVVPQVDFGNAPPDWKPPQRDAAAGDAVTDEADVETTDAGDLVTGEAAVTAEAAVVMDDEAAVAAEVDVATEEAEVAVAADEVEVAAGSTSAANDEVGAPSDEVPVVVAGEAEVAADAEDVASGEALSGPAIEGFVEEPATAAADPIESGEYARAEAAEGDEREATQAHKDTPPDEGRS